MTRDELLTLSKGDRIVLVGRFLHEVGLKGFKGYEGVFLKCEIVERASYSGKKFGPKAWGRFLLPGGEMRQLFFYAHHCDRVLIEERICEACEGTGLINYEKICENCNGLGVIFSSK